MKRAALVYRDETRIAPYEAALRSVGIEPVMVTPAQPINSLDGMGLVLSGGSDVDPATYGAKAEPLTDTPDPERDALEQRLLGEALEQDLPVLAICRGMQIFNVTKPGGTLIQDIQGHRVPLHSALVAEGTKLAGIFGAGERAVNSRHHQTVGRVGEGLIVSARAADGVIEALELPDRKFAVAVQWHPEDRMPQDRALFEAFRNSL
ncbi:MAG TPA: gamma-glutamyl-gamma-aminobutyrate hydrolase family protein [Bryobacteraceae bacterium]|jgi:gamma-glutamyl-gamma-aminobutyrate hydrolase PuuD